MKKLFKCVKDGLFGFCEFDKHMLIEPKYTDVKEFIDDKTWVKNLKGWALIDLNSKQLINQEYDDVISFDIDHSIVKKENNFFIIYNTDLVVKEIKYNFVSLSDNILLVKNNKDKYLFLDINLKPLNDKIYDDAIKFNDFFAPVCINNKWGVINNKGVQVIDYIYDEIHLFSSYLFKVKNDNQIYFIDIKQATYLQNYNPEYKFNNHYSNNALVFKYKNKFGIMDDFFEIQFIKRLDYLYDFDDEFAIYKLNNKYGIINKNGKKKSKPIFDEIYYKTDEYFYVKKDNQYNYYWLSKKKLFF